MPLCYPPRVPDPIERGRRIAVWTPTGGATWAAEAYRRIYERELLARLPGAHVRFVGDLADDAAVVSERGDVITSLAADTEAGRGERDGLIVAAADLADLAAFGRDVARDPSPQPTPYILSGLASATISVADRESAGEVLARALDVSVRDTRAQAGVRAQRSIDDSIPFVPDPMVLVNRLTGPVAARSRIEYLRTTAGFPHGDTVVVEISSNATGHLAALISNAVANGKKAFCILDSHGNKGTDPHPKNSTQASSSKRCGYADNASSTHS